MISLVKSKIESLAYSNRDSLKELYKLIGISKFVIEDKSRGCSPPYQECLEAIEQINNITESENNQATFDRVKSELLAIYDKLIAFFSEIDKTPSMNVLMHGQTSVNFNNDLKHEFLMVEQNNLDYFTDKKSHLPSQPHERLSYHHWIYESSGTVTYGFNEDSDLPEYIKAQVKEAFDRVGQKYSQKK
jgi:hypothetical protein